MLKQELATFIEKRIDECGSEDFGIGRREAFIRIYKRLRNTRGYIYSLVCHYYLKTEGRDSDVVKGVRSAYADILSQINCWEGLP